MAPLCSRIGLVGPVPKGRWWFSWTNLRYGRILSSLILTKLETLIKWMEASRFSSSKEIAPYRIYCENDVHCSIWLWWGNIAPRYIFKADDKPCSYCTSLQPHIRPALRRKKNDTWWYRTPSFFTTMQGASPLLLSRTSCAAGNGKFWDIHRPYPI